MILKWRKNVNKIMIIVEAINKVQRLQYREIPESEYNNLWDFENFKGRK